MESESSTMGNQNAETDAIMAGIEMLEMGSSSLPPVKNRVLRTRIKKKVSDDETLNRRCSLKPKKRTLEDMEGNDSTQNYYLDKNVKRSNCLETIYEEADDTNENFIRIGNKKLKRSIQFKTEPSKAKIKKRRARIKKLLGSSDSKKTKRAMQSVLDKLNLTSNIQSGSK